MTSDLERLCAERKVQITSRYGEVELPEGWAPDAHPWKVTLRYRGRSLTVPFFMGALLDREPTAADVLSCLCSDACSYDNAGSFEDWCGEFGYDTDSRKAEGIYNQLRTQAPRVHRFLGDDFETFAQAEH